jgi:hypothetical protein
MRKLRISRAGGEAVRHGLGAVFSRHFSLARA